MRTPENAPYIHTAADDEAEKASQESWEQRWGMLSSVITDSVVELEDQTSGIAVAGSTETTAVA